MSGIKLSPPTLSLSSTSTTTVVAAAATLISLSTIYYTLSSSSSSSPSNKKSPSHSNSIPSPQITLLPHLPASTISALPYPPNLIPGARDVDTPYGRMRVYEWGPEQGRKVLLVHGDTTPAPVLLPVAEALVEEAGCRVLMFDLWGRGYTSTPTSVPLTADIYAQQIHHALDSSLLTWVSDQDQDQDKFDIIAFSLGAAIAVHYITNPTSPSPSDSHNHIHNYINTLTLLAPAGLLRALPVSYTNPRISIYYKYLPYSWQKSLVASIVGADTDPAISSQETFISTLALSSSSSLTPKPQSKSSKDLDLKAIINQQLSTHTGFPQAFLSTIIHGPLQHQEPNWRALVRLLAYPSTPDSKANPSSRPGLGSGLLSGNGRILCVFGSTDTIVHGPEVREDIRDLFRAHSPFDGGEDNGDSWQRHITFAEVPGEHGFPTTAWRETVDCVLRFWKNIEG